MAIHKYLTAAIIALTLEAVPTANAALSPIDVTWNPSGAGFTNASAFTFDNVVIDTYGTLDINGNNFAEQGFLKLNTFMNNGLPVAVPSVSYPSGTPYTLYIRYAATGVQQSVIPGLPVPPFGQF